MQPSTPPPAVSILPELVAFLKSSDTYSDRPVVEVKETHISLIFLAGKVVFKLKKPVKYDFLDFSTLALRKQFCDAELRLNRRMSPTVYLDVVPVIRTSSGGLQIGTNSEGHDVNQIVEWLVKMRRLDDQRTLSHILTSNSDDMEKRSAIHGVADYLAKFYANQSPATVRPEAFRRNLQEHIEDNETQLLKLAATDAERDQILWIHSSQKRFLVTHRDQLDARVLDGRIVDGHGDLRPEHIYLYQQPLVIDCIEFNSEYRTNDIIDELAFLAMESDRIDEPTVGSTLFAAYESASNDTPDVQLIAFYKTYRACVRAKIAGLRGKQQDRGEAMASLQTEHRYLDLASRYVQDVDRRMLLLVGGLMGTGKSTLAHRLEMLLSAEVVSSDDIRHKNPSNDPHFADETASKTAFGTGNYSLASRLANYQRMMARANICFHRNSVVILDASFSQHSMREMAVKLANEHDATVVQIQCVCPHEEAIERITARKRAGRSTSEAIPEYYDLQQADAAAPLPDRPLVHVDTTLALAKQESTVLQQLEKLA